MEEGDADRMLSELVRVTRPGGRIGVIVRSLDIPPWTNVVLSPAVRAKVDVPGRGDVAAAGCADASLYQRFRRAGLIELTCLRNGLPSGTAIPYFCAAKIGPTTCSTPLPRFAARY